MNRRRIDWPRALRWLGLAVLLAHAEPASAGLRVFVAAGAALPDASFADFRWDTGPQGLVGGGLLLDGRLGGLGLRAERHGGSQGTGLPGAPAALALSLSNVELLASRRLLSLPLAGLECWGQAHAGWLRLAYSPDALTVDVGEPLQLRFDTVNELCGGGGLLLRRPLAAGLGLGLDLDALVFALDSARRVGDAVLLERQRRTNWRFGLRLDWTPGTATPGLR
ncbi:MAG: hypothetical protein R3C71_08065 [Candidatus Krumholzibacteriia bacterium]|nr:hypothetical protein [bacterium]MCB9515664.1 hypothetical protein [Candidatus Latescibacterota bacterium]